MKKPAVRFGYESKQKPKSKDQIDRKQTRIWPSVVKDLTRLPKASAMHVTLTATDLAPVTLPPIQALMRFRCGRCAVAAGSTITMLGVKVCCGQEMTQIRRRGRPPKDAGWL
jgi:hypothetical protein